MRSVDVRPELNVVCPFCFETIEVVLDLFDGNRSSSSSHSFVYDCEVCCRPIKMSITLGSDGEILADVDREY